MKKPRRLIPIGLALVFIVEDFERVILLQLGALFVGWMIAQIGIYLMPRYGRHPRPDEVLDETLRKVAKNGRYRLRKIRHNRIR